MKQSSFVLLAGLGFGSGSAHAANATAPVDYTQRNASVAPAASTQVTPAKQTPQPNAGLQDKRVEKSVVEKSTAPLAGERAAIELTEAREKVVHEKDSRRPEKREQPTSEFNHRPAAIATQGETMKPVTVAKYQDSLAAASASNMARFPALKSATTAKINRFVFRKNPPETIATDGKTVTPAAGGSTIQK